jgi:putative membrane protein
VRIMFKLPAVVVAVLLIGLTMSAAAATSTPAKPRLNAQDRTFATDVAHGALFEVQAGRLATRHSDNPEVKAFGARMVRDHSREYAELAEIADQLGLSIPHQPSADQRKAIALWSQLRGPAFDCAYIPYEVVDHELDIEHNKDELQDGANPQLKAFAARWLPVLRSHLHQAEQTLEDLHTC